MPNKGVQRVRASISKRKRQKGFNIKDKSDTQTKTMTSFFPQEEEKHGVYPTFLDQYTEGSTKKGKFNFKTFSSYLIKGTLSIILFFGVSFVWKVESVSSPSIEKWTTQALTQEFPFASVGQWYENAFGSPLPFTTQHQKTSNDVQSLALPVSGSITESFQDNGQGIMVHPNEKMEVAAIQDGIVTFAGKKKDTNKTIVVQHADGSETTYGYLDEIDVHIYQFVNSSQIMGEFTPSDESDSVYFAIEKDSEYLDPIQVIEVNDGQ